MSSPRSPRSTPRSPWSSPPPTRASRRPWRRCAGARATVSPSPRERPAILLSGETGTGKSLVARHIHEILGGGPYLELNCSGVPSGLVEAEIFGHERGSFTDAKAARMGLFEAADGGTLFFDEIGDLGLEAQAKFLHVIEGKWVRRLGSSQDREVDVHVIAATHRSLPQLVEEGLFRADVMHRRRVLELEIPRCATAGTGRCSPRASPRIWG